MFILTPLHSSHPLPQNTKTVSSLLAKECIGEGFSKVIWFSRYGLSKIFTLSSDKLDKKIRLTEDTFSFFKRLVKKNFNFLI